MTPVECKIVFNELDIEVGKVGSVLKQEQRELDRLSASYSILNTHVSLLAPHVALLAPHFISHFKVYRIRVVGQPSVSNVILSMVTPLLTLKLFP